MKGFTEVAPEDIIISEFIRNCRSEDDESEISDLVPSIRERGLLNPIRVRVNRVTEDGEKVRKYYLVAGFRRLRAVLEIRKHDKSVLPTIPCTIAEGSETDAMLDNLAENLDRRDPKPMDLASRVVELKRMGVRVEAIAGRISKHVSYLYCLADIYKNGIKEVRDLFDEGKISVQEAGSLKSLSVEKQKQVATEVKAAKSTKEKQAAIQKATGKPRMRGKKEIQEAVESIPVVDPSRNGAVKVARSTLLWVLGEEAKLPV